MLRRVAPALLLLLLGMPGLASAQYFGRNKVQYTNFKFKIIQTEHFDVYFYERERVAAMDAARMAERSYARLSKVLNHEFRERKPIILYASSADFQQTNATEVGGESTGGVTDFARNRAVMPFTGSYADFEHVLMHEMAHQFQYDIWSRGRAGAGVSTLIAIAPPLWFAEGMAEFLSIGPINSETAMWLRDASLEGKVPTIEQMTLDPYEYFPYRFGHALWSYVAERWGDEAVGAILKATLAGRHRAGVPTDHRPHPRPAVRPVARRGAEALPARARRPGPRPGGGRRAAHREEVPGHLAPRPGALARRVAGGLLHREGFLLGGPLAGRREHRQAQAPDPQIGHQQQLRDVPVHQLPGELVSRREGSRVRRQARREGRDRRGGRGQEPTGRPHQAQAQRRHDTRPGARTDSSWCSPATKAASATCSW